MTVTLREYAWMSLDAYDARARTNGPDSPAFADPAVEVEFPEWRVLPPAGEQAALRNATRTEDSGFEANVYVNDTTQQIVVAYRGTEFGRFIQEIEENDFDVIDEANLARDVESLFGYFQDNGATVTGFVDDVGGFDAFLEDVLGFGQNEADIFSGLLEVFNVFGEPVEELAEDGEAVVRAQAREAVDLALATAAANPGYEVSFTGHSLGGALAAYTAVAVGGQAVTFDPAPYAEPNWLGDLRTETDMRFDTEFTDLDLNALGWDRTRTPLEAASAFVSTYRLEGSFVEELYLTASPLDLPGERVDVEIGPLGFGLDPVTLHSPDLLTLVVDSRIREAEGRPDFETLMTGLPNFLDELDQPRSSPQDGEADTFFRTLLVEDELYAYFASVVAPLGELYRGFAPEGAEGAGAREVERALTDAFLDALPGIVEGPFDALPAAEQFLPGAPGAGDDLVLGSYARTDALSGGLGADLIAPGGGNGDTISGTLAEHDGDTITELGAGDRLIVTDVASVTVETTDEGPGDRLIVTAADGREAVLQVLSELDDLAFRVLEEEGQAVVEVLPPEALDLDGVQRVALFYEAVFDRQADDEGLNFWVDARERGMSEFALAQRFLESEEFTGLYGDVFAIEDPDYIEILYVKALNRASDGDGLAFWVDQLERLDYGREDGLISFAISEENRESATGIDGIAEVSEGEWAFA